MNQPLREGFIEPTEAPAAPRVVQPPYQAPPRARTAEPPQGQTASMPPPVMEDPPPQDEPIPVFEVSWPLQVKLVHTKPVRTAKNESVDTLSLRQPTGADINRYGNPVRMNADGDLVIDERKMTLMIAALSGLLSPTVETLDSRDWNSIAYRLRPFFLPEPGLAWV